MKGYNSANGDNRGILERFLPTTYRTTKDGSNAHNAFLGSIKGSIETTRDDVKNISLQVYFTKATGKFLDLYGKYIGLSRVDDEEDQSYRDRLVAYIQTKRGTIDAIISGIKNELNDQTVPVSIYETWRNIFILNQSNLNGLDYIMGEKYRYAVIEVTVGKYVDPNILKDIVNRYKAYGVMVIYHYSLGITENYYDDLVSFSDKYYNSNKEYSVSKYNNPYFKDYKILLGDYPLSTSELDIFKTNISNLNGKDVISGNPENAYIYDYNNSPSHHIIGYIPNGNKVIDDPYDYIYQNTKIDLSTVGGRNLYLNSRGLADGYGGNGNVKATVEPFDDTTNMWHIVLAQGNGTYVGIYLADYGKGKLPDNSDWSYSADVKGTGKIVTFGIEDSTRNPVKGNIGSKWSRISQTGHVKEPVNKSIVMYFDTRDSPLDVYIKLPKLETGTIPTDWTPAPEDTPKTYTYPFTTEPYLITSKNDSNSYHFDVPNGKSLVLGVDVSSFLINNGYSNKVKSFSPTSINSINIYTKGSEVGLPPTAISAVSANGTKIAGSFSGNSTVSDSYKSSGKYTYSFPSKNGLKELDVIDYYKFGVNTRVITITSGDLELPIAIRKGQVTGNIYYPDYTSTGKDLVVAYTNKFSIESISNANGLQIYNFTTGNWESYSGDIRGINDYIKDSSKISGAYMMVKLVGNNISLNYFNLNINAINI